MSRNSGEMEIELVQAETLKTRMEALTEREAAADRRQAKNGHGLDKWAQPV